MLISEETVIFDNESGLKARVITDMVIAGTAYALGTIYTVKGGFIPLKVYQFQAMNDKVDAESLKKIAIFFFSSLLDTERYVLEIPQDSALFPQEAARIFGAQEYERAI